MPRRGIVSGAGEKQAVYGVARNAEERLMFVWATNMVIYLKEIKVFVQSVE